MNEYEAVEVGTKPETLTLDMLVNSLNHAKENDFKLFAVEMTIQGMSKPEVIVNQIENADAKIEYYKHAYNEDLTLKAFNGIKITDWVICDNFEEVEDTLFN